MFFSQKNKTTGKKGDYRRRDGSLWEKVKTWFGYKLHLIVEANYELPVAFSVTPASWAEVPQAHALLTRMETRHPGILEECKEFLGDKGYDDGKLHVRLWDGKGIKPVIDIRNHWKDGEKTRLVTGQSNVVYDYRGTVYCHCPATDKGRWPTEVLRKTEIRSNTDVRPGTTGFPAKAGTPVRSREAYGFHFRKTAASLHR